MKIRIASFNIEKFSRQSVYYAEDSESRKDIEMIAKIIRENNFDIIALQEVFHPEALKCLLRVLSNQIPIDVPVSRMGLYTAQIAGFKSDKWEARWAKPRTKYSDMAAEGYAFIWNTKRIELSKNMKGKAFEPRIADYGHASELVRPPLIARFNPLRSYYEIRLINTHIVFSIKDEDKLRSNQDGELISSSTKLRNLELQILLKGIYKRFSEMVVDYRGIDKYARNLVPYTFLLGDYNLNLQDVNHVARPSECLDFDNSIGYINGRKKMWIETVNSKKTTLRKNSLSIDNTSNSDITTVKTDVSRSYEAEDYLANNFDHFSFDLDRLDDHDIAFPEHGVICAYESYKDDEVNNRFEQYTKKVSDHLPIYLDFNLKK
jgi:endonuclease/exonuclease/phosphatase family protein